MLHAPDTAGPGTRGGGAWGSEVVILYTSPHKHQSLNHEIQNVGVGEYQGRTRREKWMGARLGVPGGCRVHWGQGRAQVAISFEVQRGDS